MYKRQVLGGSGAFLTNPFGLTTYPPLCLGVSVDFLTGGGGGETTGVEGFGSGICTVL